MYLLRKSAGKRFIFNVLKGILMVVKTKVAVFTA